MSETRQLPIADCGLRIEDKSVNPQSLRALIKEDYAAHDSDWTRPGFRAVAVHRFGNWRMGIPSKLFRAPFSVLYRMMFRRVRNIYGIELPYTVTLGRRVIFEHQSGIVIHGNSVIGDGCIIRQGVTLGNKTLDRPLDAPTLQVWDLATNAARWTPA